MSDAPYLIVPNAQVPSSSAWDQPVCSMKQHLLRWLSQRPHKKSIITEGSHLRLNLLMETISLRGNRRWISCGTTSSQGLLSSVFTKLSKRTRGDPRQCGVDVTIFASCLRDQSRLHVGVKKLCGHGQISTGAVALEGHDKDTYIKSGGDDKRCGGLEFAMT